MKITFDATAAFEAYREAERWCDERGISVGIPERGQPCGLAHEDCRIAKWSNLRPHERAQMDGTMTGDVRHGPLTITLKGDPDDYPVIPEKYLTE